MQGCEVLVGLLLDYEVWGLEVFIKHYDVVFIGFWSWCEGQGYQNTWKKIKFQCFFSDHSIDKIIPNINCNRVEEPSSIVKIFLCKSEMKNKLKHLCVVYHNSIEPYLVRLFLLWKKISWDCSGRNKNSIIW